MIWRSGILDGFKGCVASGKCVMCSKSVFLNSRVEEEYEVFLQDGQVLLDVELVFPSHGTLL
jgi:hypothetical protein